MDFMVKRFNSLFGIAISIIVILGVMYLFVSALPYVLVIGLITWLVFKVVKIFKSFSNKKESVINSMNNAQADSAVNSEEYTTGEIIDVEYKEL